MTRNRRAAFSLVELLVVMGIILVLISILLPVVGSVRSLGSRTVCQNNVRSLLMATQVYVMNDSEGHLPYANWLGLDSPSKPGWLYAGTTNGSVSSDDMQTGSLWKYIRDERTYHCPLHQQPYQPAGPTQNITSYIMNGAVCGYGAKSPSYSWTAIWKPSESMILFECSPYGRAASNGTNTTGAGGIYFNDGASYPTENTLSNRHGTGASVGFFDWHVEYFQVSNYEVMLTQYPGPLWCNPATVHSGTATAGD